jgi:hypothetical protein
MHVETGERGFFQENQCMAPGDATSGRYVWALLNANKEAWEECKEGGTATKYESNQCTKASSTGKWGWGVVTSSEKVSTVGFTLTFVDKKATGGAAKIRCVTGFTETGTIGSEASGKIEAAEVSNPSTNCARVEGGCKSGEVEKVKGVHLPWNTHSLLIENSGAGEPGWEITCNTLLGKGSDKCESEESEKSLPMRFENRVSIGVLLVLAAFGGSLMRCSQGGAESGEIEGNVAILSSSGVGLRLE